MYAQMPWCGFPFGSCCCFVCFFILFMLLCMIVIKWSMAIDGIKLWHYTHIPVWNCSFRANCDSLTQSIWHIWHVWWWCLCMVAVCLFCFGLYFLIFTNAFHCLSRRETVLRILAVWIVPRRPVIPQWGGRANGWNSTRNVLINLGWRLSAIDGGLLFGVAMAFFLIKKKIMRRG